MEFEKDKILAQLDRITSDKSFSRSKINIRLLSFLVQSTLENIDVKEMTIGIKFFGPKYDPLKSDNKVRVYVFHLRKKLEEYYQNTASSDEILFSIDKGQYKVRFEKYSKIQVAKNPLHRLYYFLGVLIVCASLFALFYKKPVSSFWKTLMQNDFSTTVIFGDYFTIEGPTPTSEQGIIRDYEINTEQDFRAYLEKHPEQANQYRASRHHYFNWMAPQCSRNITEFWGDYKYPFEITQISEWSVSQLEKKNLVYFGQSKTMGVLKNILVEYFPQYTYKSQKLERIDPKTKKKTVYDAVINYDDKITDYTVVAKIAMPSGNEMRFFLSDQDCGAISALQYFTQNDSVKAFYNRHNIKEEEDFIALFKVTGWQRKSYEMKFILLDKKTNSKKIAQPR